MNHTAAVAILLLLAGTGALSTAALAQGNAVPSEAARAVATESRAQGQPASADPASLSLQSAADGATSSPAISTDRPSFSDGTGFVPTGHFQLETGYLFTFRDRDRDGAETQRHNAPEALARFTLLEDRFELRFITSGYTWACTESGGESDSVEGWSDLALGFKLKLLDQDRRVPRLAFGAQTTLGGGSEDISTQIAEPTLKLIWSYDLGLSFGDEWKGFTLGGNANIAWPTTGGDRFTQGQGSVYLSFPLVDRLTGFAEYYVIGPTSKDSDEAHYVDVGGVYLLDNRVQLDFRVGVGLNEEADNVFVGMGISFLF